MWKEHSPRDYETWFLVPLPHSQELCYFRQVFGNLVFCKTYVYIMLGTVIPEKITILLLQNFFSIYISKPALHWDSTSSLKLA